MDKAAFEDFWVEIVRRMHVEPASMCCRAAGGRANLRLDEPVGAQITSAASGFPKR
jgi:hypothetical protein